MLFSEMSPMVRLMREYDDSGEDATHDHYYGELVNIFAYIKSGERLEEWIDYNRYAETFNRFFFVRNVLKANALCGEIKKLSVNTFSVLDVGAGSGAASVGWLINNRSITDKLVLLDVCERQLIAAKKNLQIIGFSNADYLNEWFNPELDYGESLRLFSYWFCEQPRDFDSNPIFWSSVFGKASIIIDYSHILDEVLQRLPSNYSHFQWSIPLQVGVDEKKGEAMEGEVNGVFIFKNGSCFELL